MREPGQTFRPDQVGFFDWETHSTVDISDGTYRYMTGARPLILSYAIGEGPQLALPYPFTWTALPREIRDHHARVQAGEAVWAAWNASFDREVWNQLTDFPELEPEYAIDVMAQATAAGLPGKLDGAARFAGVPIKKRASGKDLIKLFTLPDSTATPLTHPEEWAEFMRYAADDIGAMRGVFRFTLQLPIEEWQEYWVSERINLNGIAFDQALATRAKIMATKDKANSAGELHGLTGGKVDAVTKVIPMINWLKTALQPADQGYLLKRAEETDEDTGEVIKKEKLSLDRRRIQLLTAMLDAKEKPTASEIAARRLLDIRQYGGSTTPAKFSRMLDSHVDGLLLGQYVFGGAPQTGRFSSRGVQIHNLMRDALPYEMDAIDSLLNGATVDSFATLGDNTAICRKLSMLIRPTLIPEDPDNVFTWGDWSQIEARITPWLANVESRLDIFREVDDDPTKPDLYVRTAAAMSNVSVKDITPEMRQRGKVSELALTFCGGKGALQNMAANYGMFLSDDDAQLLVDLWREANPWAQDFSRKLWDAAHEAHEAPGTLHTVNGKIGFIYLSDYLDGSLLMQLPSGRFLTYRRLRWEIVHEYDDNDEITDSRWELTFARGYGRIKLWPGFFVENCIAEGTPVLTERGWVPIEKITDEFVWDGETFVAHSGLIDKGVQDVIEVDGVWMTPDHRVLTTEGWQRAEEGHRFDRAAVRLPHGAELRWHPSGQTLVERALRLRHGVDRAEHEHDEGARNPRLPVVRDEGQEHDTRHGAAPGVLGVAFDARPLPAADASGVAQLRRPGDRSVRTLEKIRELLDGYGAGLHAGADVGTSGQQSGLLERKLPVGHVHGAGQQPAHQHPDRYTVGEYDSVGGSGAQRDRRDNAAVPAGAKRARVYDLLDAGHHHRFVVAGRTAPLIVHNCTQAVAADILRGTLVRIDESPSMPMIRAHTHDEVLLEVHKDRAGDVAERLLATMEQGFDWSKGLPLKAEMTSAYSYTKCKRAQGL